MRHSVVHWNPGRVWVVFLRAGRPRCPPTPYTNMVVGYAIGGQGANHRTWLKIVRTTDASGNAVLTTNRAFVELATGLNYRDPATGNWLPAREEIDGYPGGAIEQYGQHKVIFANNLNSAGAIRRMLYTAGACNCQ